MKGLSALLPAARFAPRLLVSLAALLGGFFAGATWSAALPLAEIESTLRGQPEVAGLAQAQATAAAARCGIDGNAGGAPQYAGHA